MKEWTAGELQALRGAANVLATAGIIMVLIGGGVIGFLWKDFAADLPQSLVGCYSLALVGGIAVLAAGCKLSAWIRKYCQDTGKSDKPFQNTSKTANKAPESSV
jgi:hypothetical protein